MSGRKWMINLVFFATVGSLCGQGNIPDKEFPAHKIIGNITDFKQALENQQKAAEANA